MVEVKKRDLSVGEDEYKELLSVDLIRRPRNGRLKDWSNVIFNFVLLVTIF